MDRPGVWQVLEGSGELGKMEKTGCKIICGAQSTLAVKGLMRMMRRRSLKAGKSPRVDNTFSELLQSEGEAATTVLTAICQKIWETKEWLVLPLPKRNILRQCKNYHTISQVRHLSQIMLRVILN